MGAAIRRPSLTQRSWFKLPLLPGQFKRSVLNVIESRLRRRRSGDKNAPRTIDLDISLFNESVLTIGHRRIPDPELSRFAHIAIPLAEIAPDYIHPHYRGAP